MKFISGGTALTPNGWQDNFQVGIGDDGRVAYAGPEKAPADINVDVLLPAPVNLHSHTFQRAMAGLTELRGPSVSDSFWTWRSLMYRFLDQLDPDQIEAIATLAFMEMLEAGFGGVAEFHYLHHGAGGEPYPRLGELSERMVAAAETTGIGLALLPVFYEFGGCDRRSLQGGQLRFQNDFDRYQALYEQAGQAIAGSNNDYALGIAPHSLRAVDPVGLKRLLLLRGDGPVHMHIAEQLAEVEEVQAHLGARPMEWLLNNHDVDDHWCLIHCTQMTEEETQQLARSDAVAGLCPITESSLGDGIFNGTSYFPAGGRAGVGSDSNIHISLFDELKTLEYSQRLRDRSRAALATSDQSTGRVLFDAAATGGAQAAKRPSGVIAEGMLADLVGLTSNNQWIRGRNGDAILDSLIFGGFGQRCITDVWSAGRHVVSEGQHKNHDAIVSAYLKVMSEIGTEI